MSQTYLYKVFINGDFRSVVEAANHDAAVTNIRENWLIQSADKIELERFKVLMR